MKKSNPLRPIYLEHIRSQQASSLSAKDYCEYNNLELDKFSYYLNYKPTKKRLQREAKKSIFSEVKLNSSVSSNSKVQSTPIDPVWLAKFLNELRL